MATQTIELTAPTGLAAPTLRVFADGSDVQVAGSPFTLVESTNRKGHYAVTFTGTLAGTHLVVLYDGANPLASGWVVLFDADGTYFVAGDNPAAAADKALGRNLAGGSDGGRTVRDSLRAGRNKVAFDVPAAGQFTVYAEDDSTPAWTGTYARGAAALGPLTGTDPA